MAGLPTLILKGDAALVIQRNIDSVRWEGFETAIRSQGGRVTGVYFLQHPDNSRIVVKLSKNGKDTIDLQKFMTDIANVPDARSVEIASSEGERIVNVLRDCLSGKSREDFKTKLGSSQFTDFVIMEVVEGKSFNEILPADFVETLSDANVLKAIGKQAVVDAFLGIGDRFHVGYNPGNLMVDSSRTIYAIDNDTDTKGIDYSEKIKTIEGLLNEGSEFDQLLRFIRTAAFNSGVLSSELGIKEVTRIIRSDSTKRAIKTGIKEGFKAIKAKARMIQEGDHLYDTSQAVINLDARRKKCFLTTACTEYKGLPDNCVELETLRQFRDHYMYNLPRGKYLINLYYYISPIIIDRINSSMNRVIVYEGMYKTITTCVQYICEDREEEALAMYCRMVIDLSREYLTETQISRIQEEMYCDEC